MLWKKRLLKNSSLYLILDTQVNTYSEIFEITKKAVKYGVDIVQLRDKGGKPRDILEFSRRIKKLLAKRALFIINDRVDLALIARADGVHLGQDDVPIKEARKILGSQFIIGASCQRVEHVKDVQKQGADYIGFGSVFKTLTKPDRLPMNLRLLEKANSKARIPLFAIGGITLKNISKVKSCGVTRVAVCREICESSAIKNKILKFKQSLEK